MKSCTALLLHFCHFNSRLSIIFLSYSSFASRLSVALRLKGSDPCLTIFCLSGIFISVRQSNLMKNDITRYFSDLYPRSTVSTGRMKLYKVISSLQQNPILRWFIPIHFRTYNSNIQVTKSCSVWNMWPVCSLAFLQVNSFTFYFIHCKM